MYSSFGTLLREEGRAGQGPGEFQGLGPRSKLVVGHGKAIVLASGAQRIQVFDLPEWKARSSFAVTALPTDVGFDGAELHMTLRSIAGNLTPGLVYRFSLGGELLGSYGEVLQPEWEDAGAPRALSYRNDAELAVDDRGDVVVALRWWPSMRVFRNEVVVVDEWMTFDWVDDDDPGRVEMYNRPRELVEDLDARAIESNRALAAQMMFDATVSTDSVFLLMNGGGFLAVLDREGTPRGAYELRGPDPSNGLRDDLIIPFVDGLQIAASPDGSRVCVPLRRRAAVFCYAIEAGVTE